MTSDIASFSQSQFPFSYAGNSGGSAQFRTRQTWSGTLDGVVPVVSFQLGYVNDGVQTSSLGQVAGNYNSWPVAASPNSTATMTVDASGAISGTYFSGCGYTGQLAATAQANVYDMTINFTGTCYLLSLGPVTGMLFHDAAHNRIYAAAVTATSTPNWQIRGGFMFVSQ